MRNAIKGFKAIKPTKAAFVALGRPPEARLYTCVVSPGQFTPASANPLSDRPTRSTPKTFRCPGPDRGAHSPFVAENFPFAPAARPAPEPRPGQHAWAQLDGSRYR